MSLRYYLVSSTVIWILVVSTVSSWNIGLPTHSPQSEAVSRKLGLHTALPETSSLATRQGVRTTLSSCSLSNSERRDVLESFVKSSLAIVGASVTTSCLLPILPATAAYIDPAIDPPAITKRVYLDVSFTNVKGEATTGRIVIGLFGNVMPKTVDNFYTLCSNNAYGNTTFYRVLSDFSIQGGAIGDPSGKTGTPTPENGDGFEPDNYNIKHTKTGLISMVKGLDGKVDSRFFINCNDNGGWGDDWYAAFGIVETNESLKLVKQIELVPVQPPKNAPKSPVRIVASGVL